MRNLLNFRESLGKDLGSKYYEMFKYQKGKFIIKGLKEDDENNINNTDNLVEKKEEDDPMDIKIKNDFIKNIITDFKKILSPIWRLL